MFLNMVITAQLNVYGDSCCFGNEVPSQDQLVKVKAQVKTNESQVESQDQQGQSQVQQGKSLNQDCQSPSQDQKVSSSVPNQDK